eukprot:11160031-Lingulodinium_polyedra.AAC.1
MALQECPDQVSSNTRKLHASASRLPDNCLHLPSTAVRGVNRVAVVAVPREGLIGDLYALAYVS